MKDEINTNGIFQPTPEFESCENFKEFFIRDDALANVSTELVFSIFKRYTCKAGCDMCYVQDEWIEDGSFEPFVPNEITPEIEAKMLAFFEYFEIVTTMDDLYTIKKTYPHLFEFYKKHSHLMSSTAMTDIAFIQQYDIIMNELDFQTIYEISFSDIFLNKKNGDFVNTLIEKLDCVHDKSPIRKLKIILCNHTEDDAAVHALIAWAKTYNIYVDIHDDFTQETNDRFILEKADHQETNHFSEENYLYLIKCEVVYLQFTELFLTISDTISKDSVPFYDIDKQNDIPAFLSQMLVSKVKMYDKESRLIGPACDNKYFDYFTYVASSVTVNEDYNFIPRFVLKPYTKIYQRLAEEGFINTPHGLIKEGTTTPKMLFDVGAAPKLKLHHIPIKCDTV